MRADAVSRAVLEQLRELHCLEPEQTVCCALSGGADSVCLLRCLLELRPVLGITITAVHVNHHLRGAESERDRAFCQQLCAGLGVRLAVYDVNPAARAAQEHCSEELAARECRYAAFAQVQADWIATAHTASDNLETAVHRLVRGASLHGLTAIPPKNGRFLRPLLRVTRRQVEQYLESLGQTYVTDSTNLTDAYTRNRIRHQVIPALEQLNPSVERTVSYTLRSLRREDDFLHQQAQAAYAKCHTGKNTLSGLETLHEALQFRCIAMLLEEAGISCEAPLLERLAALAETLPLEVRFIEMMPIGSGASMPCLAGSDVLARLQRRWPELTLLPQRPEPAFALGPAIYYKAPGWKGSVGFIAAVHGKFCAGCNRIRLTSQGFLRLCLASEAGCDLRTPLRSGASDAELLALLRNTIREKPLEHHFGETGIPATSGMYRIGG